MSTNLQSQTRFADPDQELLRHSPPATQEQIHEILVVAQLGTWEWDPSTDRVTISDELVARTAGELPDEATLDDALAPVKPEHRDALRRSLHRLAFGDLDELEESYQVTTQNPDLRWVEVRGRPTYGEDGLVTVTGTVQDVSARKLAEERLLLQAHLLDAVDAALIATDIEGTITYWNAAAERMYGWTANDAIGWPITGTAVDTTDAATANEIMEATLTEGRWSGELEVRRKDGSPLTAQIQDAVVRQADGVPIGIVRVTVDLTDRLEAERELRTAHDYMSAVAQSMAEGMYVLDADGRITYANGAAERVLGWSSQELIGERADDTIHHPRPDGTRLSIAQCPLAAVLEQGESIEVDDDAFMRKNGSMVPVAYAAAPLITESGRQGAVVVFSDITERKREQERWQHEREALAWIGRIRDALDEDRLVLHAQPIVDLRTGKVARHELLVRMLGSDGELVAPGRFLPTAERFTLIHEIDHRVVEQAVELAATGYPVNVNLSAKSIGDPRVSHAVEHVLRNGNAEPGMLGIEITETALIESQNVGRAFIRRVSELGCQVALDDFGTGYGSFTYLKQLPVSCLKIDTQFVRDLLDEPENQVVVNAIIDLANGFGLDTVAEGVEDERTLDALRELGVDYAQGFAVGSPMPVGEALMARSIRHRPPEHRRLPSA